MFEFLKDGTMGPTKGVLDLGGASTQITFVPKSEPAQIRVIGYAWSNDEWLTSSSLHLQFQTQVPSTTTCWLRSKSTASPTSNTPTRSCAGESMRSPCFTSPISWGWITSSRLAGLVIEWLKVQLALILKNNGYKDGIRAPCYPKGSDTTINSNSIINSPCANGLIFNFTYNFTANVSFIPKVKEVFEWSFLSRRPTNYPSWWFKDMSLSYSGFSEYENCQQQVRVLLPQPGCPYDTCSFDGVYQPKIYDSGFMVRLACRLIKVEISLT